MDQREEWLSHCLYRLNYLGPEQMMEIGRRQCPLMEFVRERGWLSEGQMLSWRFCVVVHLLHQALRDAGSLTQGQCEELIEEQLSRALAGRMLSIVALERGVVLEGPLRQKIEELQDRGVFSGEDRDLLSTAVASTAHNSGDSSTAPANLSCGDTLLAFPQETETTLSSPSVESGAKMPEMLGPYRIDSEIGKGGMGRVYRAYHPQLERTVAIKIMLAASGAGSAERGRFLTEARLAARLKHPNIVAVHDVNSQAGLDYMVMEYVAGESLESILKRERLPMRRSLEIIRDVARAVDYAHQNGVIHRDLKPSNLILESGGNPIIMDFGLAKNIQDSVNLTQTGQILGTPRYMSPEQASGEKISHLTDIYSLGVIFYEMLTGVCPVAGDTLVNIIYSIVHKPVVPLREHNPDIPQQVEKICLTAMEKNPARRYQNAGEMAGAIDKFLHQEAGPATRKARPILKKVVAAVAVLLLIAAYMGHKAFNRQSPGPISAEKISPLPAEVRPPESPEAGEDEKLAVQYFERANLLVERQNFKAALPCYDEAIRLKAKFSEAYRMRGRLHHIQGDLASAFVDYDRAVDADPENHWAYHDRGLVHLTRGELDNAIADYDQSLRVKPNFLDGYNNRAICHSQKGEVEKAISDMGKAINLSPEDAGLYYSRGSMNLHANNLAAALADFNSAIQYDETDARAYYCRGYIYHRGGKLLQALSNYNQAIRLKINDPVVYHKRAEVLKAQGRHREAVEDLKKYLELVPDAPEATELRKYIDDHGR